MHIIITVPTRMTLFHRIAKSVIFSASYAFVRFAQGCVQYCAPIIFLGPKPKSETFSVCRRFLQTIVLIEMGAAKSAKFHCDSNKEYNIAIRGRMIFTKLLET